MNYTLNALPQCTSVNKNVTAWACWTLASCPCLTEKCLTLKILVKLICKFDLNISQNPFTYLLHLV